MGMVKKTEMKETKRKELEAKIKEADGKVTEEQKKFVEFLEKEYKCSGLCEPAMFYITVDTMEGRPQNTCALGLIESIADQLTLFGYTLFFTGVIMFIVFCLMW